MSPDAAALALPNGWTEQSHERETYGPDDREGRAVTFERGSARVSVLPVRYECARGRERLHALTREFGAVRRELTALLPDVAPRTAFATHVEYPRHGATETDVVCVAADADDALAVGVWLTGVAADDRALDRAVRRHRGEGASAGASISDDEALTGLFAGEPDRCPFTGKPTASHRIELPYRYVTVLDGGVRAPSGVPRFPSTVDALVGVVSHAAWEETGLGDLDTRRPLERAGPGEYRLDDAVARAFEGADAGAFALRRPGE